MLTSGKRFRAWWLVHRWTSLISGLFLLVLCLTGLPLVFEDEIEAWSDGTARAEVSSPPREWQAVDALVEQVRRQRPNEFVEFVFFPEDRPGTIGVGVAKTLRA